MIPFAREPREKKIAAFINEAFRHEPGHRAHLLSPRRNRGRRALCYRPIFPTVLRETRSEEEEEEEKGGRAQYPILRFPDSSEIRNFSFILSKSHE